ncbi:Zn-dependent peptidase ImmA (M78 family) [Metabacillus crassostreae]|uniref:ImmA/IrrE family metallo-endopeptidase n=1 Tax=Metabacillus crassostreae TaxID=929098 RepID=UPI0019582198|nr:ImmA/IrrE family metallo-endopeptidase [Metabacillus crassostreae]MBM7606024.1 Zn-dependent peptidase ImmA (M78 family) [Metabacillus crassostreae]
MKYQMSHLEEDVKGIYRKLNISEPISIDMCRIAEEFDVWIHPHEYKSQMIERDGMYSILLDKRITKEEQWQDFGHELGHVINHAGNQHKMNKLFRDLQEYQANNFMFHFCVPTFMLLKMQFPDRRGQAVKMIAENFNVTCEFADKRLKQFENKISGALFHKQYIKLLTLSNDEKNEILKQVII